MGNNPTDTAAVEETEDGEVRYVRRSREEVARLADGRAPFDYERWMRTAPPATPEELAETEEFLRQRELERQASIAAETARYLRGSSDEEPAEDADRAAGG
ncbi:MAG: hypothetical protein ACK47B_10375 [Armatimonadota bacterium]